MEEMKEQEEEEEGQGDRVRAEGDGEWRGERWEEKGKMWGRLERKEEREIQDARGEKK